MKIILLERVARLGQVGDIVQVKNGYARNFLLPKGKALRANDANIKQFEAERSKIEARNLEMQKDAEAIAERLNGQSITIIRRAGQTGQLYGSVNSRDIVNALSEIGFQVERSQIQLSNPIKNIGLHNISAALFADIAATVNVNVARSEEEAERQAQGEDMRMNADQATQSNSEDAIQPEEIFEDNATSQPSVSEPDASSAGSSDNESEK